MKIAIWILAVLLLIAAGLAGYAVYDSEPDMLLAAGGTAAAAFIPLIIVLLNRMLLAANRGVKAASQSMGEKFRKSAQDRELKNAEKREVATARQRENEKQAIELNRQAELAKQQAIDSRLNSEVQADPAPSQTKPPANNSYGSEPTLRLPSHRLARTTAAVAALLAFLILPQFQILVNLNGIQIVKHMVSGNSGKGSQSEKNPFADENDIQVSSSRSESNSEGGVTFALSAWVALITLFACVPAAYFANVKADLVGGAICSAALILTMVAFNLEVQNSAELKDNPIAQGMMQMFGFTWGYYITILLSLYHAFLAFTELKKRRGHALVMPQPELS